MSSNKKKINIWVKVAGGVAALFILAVLAFYFVFAAIFMLTMR